MYSTIGIHLWNLPISLVFLWTVDLLLFHALLQKRLANTAAILKREGNKKYLNTIVAHLSTKYVYFKFHEHHIGKSVWPQSLWDSHTDKTPKCSSHNNGLPSLGQLNWQRIQFHLLIKSISWIVLDVSIFKIRRFGN